MVVDTCPTGSRYASCLHYKWQQRSRRERDAPVTHSTHHLPTPLFHEYVVCECWYSMSSCEQRADNAAVCSGGVGSSLHDMCTLVCCVLSCLVQHVEVVSSLKATGVLL